MSGVAMHVTIDDLEVRSAFAALTYAGGRLVAVNIDKGILFWGSDFAAGYYLRK